MPKYRITPKALEDLKSIGQYTQRQWGKAQRNRYLKQLEQRFEWLALNLKNAVEPVARAPNALKMGVFF